MGDFDFSEFLPSDNELKENSERFTRKEDEYYKDRNDNPEPWHWNGKQIEEIPEEFKEHQSFVYLITNKVNKKRYVGFKTIVSRRFKSVKGKKKSALVESDWRTYFSSSQELLHDVGVYGRGNFLREIIAFTVNKGVGKYYEAEEQFRRGVISNHHEEYYNGIVNLRLNHNLVKQYDGIVKAKIILGDCLVKAGK